MLQFLSIAPIIARRPILRVLFVRSLRGILRTLLVVEYLLRILIAVLRMYVQILLSLIQFSRCLLRVLLQKLIGVWGVRLRILAWR